MASRRWETLAPRACIVMTKVAAQSAQGTSAADGELHIRARELTLLLQDPRLAALCLTSGAARAGAAAAHHQPLPPVLTPHV